MRGLIIALMLTCVTNAVSAEGNPPNVRLVKHGSPASGLWSRPPAGVTLKFADDFASGSLDPSKWRTSYPSGERKLDKEAEIYVDAGLLREHGLSAGRLPFGFANKQLTIQASLLPSDQASLLGAKYQSGMITTAGLAEFKFGYIEMRAKLPKGSGLWPAFWLMRPGASPYGEIDIVEMLGHDPTVIYATTHAGENWSKRHISQAKTETAKPVSGDFHTYGVDWNDQSITFYFDRKPVKTVPTPDDLKSPMYIIANLAVGGPWGETVDDSAMPAKMRIDYIRVWSGTGERIGPAVVMQERKNGF